MGFWADLFPEIQAIFWNLLEIFSQVYSGWYFQNLQNRFSDLLIKIEQKPMFLPEEDFDVVGIVFEERGGVVGRKDGSPLVSLPFFVVGDL